MEWRLRKNKIHPYEQRAAHQYNILIISLDGLIYMFLYFFRKSSYKVIE